MKTLFLIWITGFTISCATTQNHQASDNKEKKTVDVDRIACSWNKNQAQADKDCQPDPNKETIGKRLDTQLSKDAKKLKSFFGIKSKAKSEAEAE